MPSDADLLKLAHKLIETFSRWEARGFERYWPLVGPVETFSEGAVGPLEERVAKALSIALEAALKRTAPRSILHPDAPAAAVLIDHHAFGLPD
jgi:hypothetical protein